jgi:hypothetical protein
MDDRPFESLLLDPFQRMTAQERIAEICRILAAGLIRARAKGTLPAPILKPPKGRAKSKEPKRYRSWAGSRVV